MLRPNKESGGPDVSRRAALAAIGACAGSAIPMRAGSAPSAVWRVDVHHHFASPAYAAFAAAHPEAGLPPAPPDTIARSLEDMDRGGTRLAVLSSFVPPIGGSVADRRGLARVVNEFGAGAVRDHPGRFALFAVLPFPDIEGCLSELDYGLDTLGAVGVSVYSEALGKYLGDDGLSPLLQALDARRAVVFVHPHTDACCHNLIKEVPDSIIEYGVSTARTIASLIFSGAADRYPNIKFIFSHGGGVAPFLVERFLGGTAAEITPGVTTRGQGSAHLNQPKGGALAALRRFHYDTAQIANPVALRALAAVATPSQLLYGTDFWFRDSTETAQGLDASGVFTQTQLKAIARDNALLLMPALADHQRRS